MTRKQGWIEAAAVGVLSVTGLVLQDYGWLWAVLPLIAGVVLLKLSQREPKRDVAHLWELIETWRDADLQHDCEPADSVLLELYALDRMKARQAVTDALRPVADVDALARESAHNGYFARPRHGACYETWQDCVDEARKKLGMPKDAA